MANLIDTASAWEAGIYQIETTDPVVGGVPNPSTGAGMSNIPHLQLARRTQWMRAQIEALQNSGGYRAALTFSGNQTLTAANAGTCYIYGETTPVTLTLPLIADTPVGSIFEFINTGTANMTVQRAGSNEIDIGPTAATSIVIPPNQSLKLIRATGTSLWHPVSATALTPPNQLGWGQTVVDVKASRAANTAYQNTTGRPIFVAARTDAVTSTHSWEVSSNGSTWVKVAGTSGQAAGNASFVVPNGWFYRFSGTTANINDWAEYR